ncbi:MAG: NERD domain-containing protein [Bacilli bacterium]|nr:NERD domain-containing protein [Bacilli bacterium]
MTLLSSTQVAYIVSAIFAGALVLFLFALLIYKGIYAKKHIRELTYLKLYKLAQKHDYLLLNNYRVPIDDHNTGFIDHILISKKFIILINDFAISGVLSGDSQSEELRNLTKKGTSIVVNPLNYNINMTKRLALFNDLDHRLLKGLVVINNDSYINVNHSSGQFKIIKRKDLEKTIKQFDEADVKNLKEEDVVRFVNYLDKNN